MCETFRPYLFLSNNKNELFLSLSISVQLLRTYGAAAPHIGC